MIAFILMTTEGIYVLCYSLSLSCFQPFATPWAVAHQDPLSMGILQARILEWMAMLSSRGSFQPKDQTQVSLIAGRFFTELPGKLKNIGVGSLSLWASQIFFTLMKM